MKKPSLLVSGGLLQHNKGGWSLAIRNLLAGRSIMKRGSLILVIGPSGVGKNTLLKQALSHVSDYAQMPTATSRPRRADELEGREHFFMSDDQFEQFFRKGAFAESQVIHGNRYGTLRTTLEEGIKLGKNYIADIDPEGAMLLKEQYPDYVVLVFISPPSRDALEKRLKLRGSISKEELAIRLSRVDHELAFASRCQYVIRNDSLDNAVAILVDIMISYRSQ